MLQKLYRLKISFSVPATLFLEFSGKGRGFVFTFVLEQHWFLKCFFCCCSFLFLFLHLGQLFGALAFSADFAQYFFMCPNFSNLKHGFLASSVAIIFVELFCWGVTWRAVRDFLVFDLLLLEVSWIVLPRCLLGLLLFVEEY